MENTKIDLHQLDEDCSTTLALIWAWTLDTNAHCKYSSSSSQNGNIASWYNIIYLLIHVFGFKCNLIWTSLSHCKKLIIPYFNVFIAVDWALVQ